MELINREFKNLLIQIQILKFFRFSLAGVDEYKRKLEQIKSEVCPKRISGASRRRFVTLSSKTSESLSEQEKSFMEYANYSRDARQRYFHEKFGDEGKTRSSDKTDDISIAQQIPEAKPNVVDMNLL